MVFILVSGKVELLFWINEISLFPMFIFSGEFSTFFPWPTSRDISLMLVSFSSYNMPSKVNIGANPRLSNAFDVAGALFCVWFLRRANLLLESGAGSSIWLLRCSSFFLLAARRCWRDSFYSFTSFYTTTFVTSLSLFLSSISDLSFLYWGSRTIYSYWEVARRSTLAFFLYSCSSIFFFILSSYDISCSIFFSSAFASISSYDFSFFPVFYIWLRISGFKSVFWIRSVKYMYFSSFIPE